MPARGNVAREKWTGSAGTAATRPRTGKGPVNAQAEPATNYGFRTWSDMMPHVGTIRGQDGEARSLLRAVKAGDLDAVRTLLSEGVNPRVGDGRETPLHAAARRGPVEMVEALIAAGAREWQRDAAGRTPLDAARRGRAPDKGAIVAILDRLSTADETFKAAIDALHAGDVAALARLLDDHPRLLRDRIVEPRVYHVTDRYDYFLDPKLFWFVANNPTLTAHMPPTIADVAELMIERGVEQSDLDYTLGLTMTSASAREHGVQRSLMRTLLAAGAEPGRDTILSTAAHRELDALRALLDAGAALSAPIAAALGDVTPLRDLLAHADAADVQAAFAMAVINGELEAARIALDAGADVNAFLPVHAHSTALHQAAASDDVPLIEMLLDRGARTDCRDTLWDGTPLDWAIHEHRSAARDVLERRR